MALFFFWGGGGGGGFSNFNWVAAPEKKDCSNHDAENCTVSICFLMVLQVFAQSLCI